MRMSASQDVIAAITGPDGATAPSAPPGAPPDGAEPALERMALMAARAARAPIGLVCVAGSDRQLVKAALGLEPETTPWALSFCAEATRSDEVVWVEDAARHETLAANPLTAGAPGVRFSAAAPITVQGRRCGAVCIMDAVPRAYDPEVAAILALAAEACGDALRLRRTLKDLADARDAADAAVRAKSEFLANMSHEIRTPLNGVLGVAGALRRTNLDGAQREMVGLIETSGATLCALLDDVLDIARVEQGRLELRMDSFRLDEVIRQATVLFSAAAAEKGVRLNVGHVPTRLYLGDPTRLRQILCSLISNAVKFTEEGEVEISVKAAPAVDGDRLQISVRDTGIGFQPELLDRLFERFEQGDGSLTRRRGGAGLGLAISRALAEMLGGTLEARSAPGRGSTFTLTMALQHVGPMADPGRFVDATPRTVLRILLAEDHAANRRVVELILSGSDVDLVSVQNGGEALDAFKAGQFDLVLMDMQMPVMDGLSATRAIRRHEERTGARRTPVCMLSAHAMPEHVEAAMAAGADSYLTKPITAEALLSTVIGAVQPPEG
jgi:signal transduction histidine kinase/ActR/RegA family two-component response regulator